MTRARKQTVSAVSAPKVLITREQYLQDIKVRWQIHQQEFNYLVEDVSNLVKTVSPYVKQAVAYATEKYQQLFAKPETVQ